MASKGRKVISLLGLLRFPVSSDILKYLCSLVLPGGCEVLSNDRYNSQASDINELRGFKCRSEKCAGPSL